MEEYKLLDEQARYELQEIYNRLEKFKSAMDIEYEEFVCINTAMYYLDVAINYKKKRLS